MVGVHVAVGHGHGPREAREVRVGRTGPVGGPLDPGKGMSALNCMGSITSFLKMDGDSPEARDSPPPGCKPPGRKPCHAVVYSFLHKDSLNTPCSYFFQKTRNAPIYLLGGRIMSNVSKQNPDKNEFVINEKTIEALIVRLIPTSQYFETRFDGLEQKFDYKFEGLTDRINSLEKSHEELKHDMNKRFEQVDKRFEQMDAKFDKLIERIDIRIDQGLRENRTHSFRLFSFAMTFSAISMVGMLGRLFNVF